MNEQRIHYPALASELVESINALLLAGEVPVPSSGGAVVAIRPAQPSQAGGTDLALDVSIGGSPVRVRLNGCALEQALNDLLPAPAFAALDDDLKLAVLEATLAEPLGALRKTLGAEVALGNLDAGPAEEPGSSKEDAKADGEALSSLLFEVRIPADVARCSVVVDLLSPLPAAVLAQLAAAAEPPVNDFGGLPVPVTFELGEASLSAAEFDSLEAGDVVLFDQCHCLDDRLRVNVCDHHFQLGTLEDPSAIII